MDRYSYNLKHLLFQNKSFVRINLLEIKIPSRDQTFRKVKQNNTECYFKNYFSTNLTA